MATSTRETLPFAFAVDIQGCPQCVPHLCRKVLTKIKSRNEHPSALDNPCSLSQSRPKIIRSSQQLTVLGCCLLTKSEIKSNSFWPRKSSGSSWTRSRPSSMTSEVRTSSSIISASMPLRASAGPAICCMLANWAGFMRYWAAGPMWFPAIGPSGCP